MSRCFNVSFVTRMILIVAGLLFIIGAVAKYMQLPSFEFLLVVQAHIAGWGAVPYLSRALIAGELILGINLLLTRQAKNPALPGSILLLAVFSVYLFLMLIIKGNAADCGCFGELMPMSTRAALIKNIIMIAALLWTYFRLPRGSYRISRENLIGALLIVVFVFIFNPVRPYAVPSNRSQNQLERTVMEMTKPENHKLERALPDEQKQVSQIKKMNRDSVRSKSSGKHTLSPYSKFLPNAAVDAGTTLIAILSLDCEHCQKAAKEIALFAEIEKLPKVYALFLGEEQQVKPFFEQAGIVFEYKILNPTEFFPLLTASPPRIVLLNNGAVQQQWEGDSFSTNELKSALQRIR